MGDEPVTGFFSFEEEESLAGRTCVVVLSALVRTPVAVLKETPEEDLRIVPLEDPDDDEPLLPDDDEPLLPDDDVAIIILINNILLQ